MKEIIGGTILKIRKEHFIEVALDERDDNGEKVVIHENRFRKRTREALENHTKGERVKVIKEIYPNLIERDGHKKPSYKIVFQGMPQNKEIDGRNIETNSFAEFKEAIEEAKEIPGTDLVEGVSEDGKPIAAAVFTKLGSSLVIYGKTVSNKKD